MGTAQLTEAYGVTGTRGRNSPEAAVDLLQAAWDLGVRTVDTAPAYGEAERAIGRADRPFTVHTKLARNSVPRECLDQSLHDLGCESVAVLYLHDTATLRGDRLDGFSELLDQGAEALGASIYDDRDLGAALDRSEISVIQAPCNVLDQRFTDIDAPNRMIARSAFLQGVLLADADALPAPVAHLRPFVAAFHARCRTLDLEPIVVCLAWLRHLRLEGIVVGAQTTAELTTIAEAWTAAAAPHITGEALQGLALPDPESVDPRMWA